MRFSGLRVAVGGGGQGVGAACAKLLAFQGASVAVCARSKSDLAALEKELQQIVELRLDRSSEQQRFAFIARDLGTEAGAEDFASEAGRQLGGIDLALVCAGVSQRPEPLLAPHPAQRLREQLEGNALAPALCAIAIARVLEQGLRPLEAAASTLERAPGEQQRAQRKPSPQILILSSMVTRIPAQLGLGPYLAGKAALEGVVRTLAEELWPHVRVNALCLGPVATRMHAQAGTPVDVIARFPTPDEIAPQILSLLLPSGPLRDLSGRCIDGDALLQDSLAALWGDGRFAPLLALQLPPSEMPHADDSSGVQLEPEPGRPPSPRVRAALRQTAGSLQRYPQEATRLARRLAELHQVDADRILLSGGGATSLLERTLYAVGQSGDELVSPFPTFELVSALASRAGLRHRLVPARQDAQGMFQPHRARELLAAVGPRTRAVYIASPDNPTGAVLPLEEERSLRSELGSKTALILDEAWTLEVPELTAAPVDDSSACPLLRLRSLSKLHGLAGLRIGYAIASPELASLIRRTELPYPLGAPQLAAALAALDELPRARKIALLLSRKRERLAKAIRALGLLASEGSSPLILIRDPRPGASAGPLLYALSAAGIAAQEAHWDASALTLSVGTPAQDRRAVAALARAMQP